MFKLATILRVDTLGIGAAVPLGRGYKDNDNIILEVESRKKLDYILQYFKEKYKKFIKIKIASYGGEKYYTDYLNYYQDWLLVKYNGDIKLENRLPFIVGNVRNNTIDELWKKVNYYQKSNQVINIINDCINNKKEIDNQKFIFL